ncbi:hypothetical protein [Streptomyces sporangiiformans]|uniref:ScoMcrA-like SRA domain-containing protein n=1 Tax=Streptomyces sporangiiformans TaxID=2315329 RepID=A0A505D747_9ACTN|nr:hypothetical protein [Streptomyces sporangiiformans]TPQ18420.1 hypothetical protein FGD71_031215 [Streptomyces sporangiiformans]
MTKKEIVIAPGDVVTRAQIREVFGGSAQGGICPSVEMQSVNLFSDPSVGEKLGYYDGWLAEDDDLGPVFEYTGAGMSGNQTFEGVAGAGNRAILKHAEQGRALRTFTQVGKVPGSGTKTHKYLGEFSLDRLQPYAWRQIHGADGRDRNVVVFRLRPDGEVQRSEKDIIPPAEETTAELVPFTVVTAAMLQSAPATGGALSQPKQRRKKPSSRSKPVNAATSGTFVVPESFNTRMSLRSATASFIAVRREAELTQAYKDYLESLGHTVGAFQIKVRGLSSTLRTDLYDATDHILYEVKGASAREDVRMALGQLLDYSRYVSTEAHPGSPKRIILLPSAPDTDMYDLCERYEVGLIHRSESGKFTVGSNPLEGSKVCPAP